VCLIRRECIANEGTSLLPGAQGHHKTLKARPELFGASDRMKLDFGHSPVGWRTQVTGIRLGVTQLSSDCAAMDSGDGLVLSVMGSEISGIQNTEYRYQIARPRSRRFGGFVARHVVVNSDAEDFDFGRASFLSKARPVLSSLPRLRDRASIRNRGRMPRADRSSQPDDGAIVHSQQYPGD